MWWLLLFLTASASLLLTLRAISSLVFSFVAFDSFLRFADFSLTFWLIKWKAHNVLSTVLSYYITEKLNSLRFFSFRYCLILVQVILWRVAVFNAFSVKYCNAVPLIKHLVCRVWVRLPIFFRLVSALLRPRPTTDNTNHITTDVAGSTLSLNSASLVLSG